MQADMSNCPHPFDLYAVLGHNTCASMYFATTCRAIDVYMYLMMCHMVNLDTYMYTLFTILQKEEVKDLVGMTLPMHSINCRNFRNFRNQTISSCKAGLKGRGTWLKGCHVTETAMISAAHYILLGHSGLVRHRVLGTCWRYARDISFISKSFVKRRILGVLVMTNHDLGHDLLGSSKQRVHHTAHALNNLKGGGVYCINSGKLEDFQAASALVQGPCKGLVQNHLQQLCHIERKGSEKYG